MAWALPRTWVTGENVTASIMNTHVRDNFSETSAATAVAAGDIVYADAPNSMGSRVAIGVARAHIVSDGSGPLWRVPATDGDNGTGSDSPATTTYQPLFGAGWWSPLTSVEVTVETGTAALVHWKAQLWNDAGGNITYLSYSISGATTSAAGDSRSLSYESGAANDRANFGTFDYITGLTAGTNTFKLEGRATGGGASIALPEIFVLPF